MRRPGVALTLYFMKIVSFCSSRSLGACMLPALAIVGAIDRAACLPSKDAFPAMVEETWLKRARLRALAEERKGPVTTQEDASGGCDGIKDGKWGFHTNSDPSPWWQVDLGKATPLDTVVVWNRCDGGCPQRNSHLFILSSEDGTRWEKMYEHDGTPFYGVSGGPPLRLKLEGETVRLLRFQVAGPQFFHLDEVEVFGSKDPKVNLALGKPANQSSTSQWSTRPRVEVEVDWQTLCLEALSRCKALLEELSTSDAKKIQEADSLRRLEKETRAASPRTNWRECYLECQWLGRHLLFQHPLLNFDSLLFAKRVPGSFNHMSDQYYGWWSRPGGGVYKLKDFKGKSPQAECLTNEFPEGGSFLRPMLSYKGDRLLFSWCNHYPHLQGEGNKLDKSRVPEDAFYHVFHMDLETGAVRRLTRGKYDDFDARYLPNGRIVFLSTRRGQFLQCGRASAALTLKNPDLPDCYVRCGGGPQRPVAVYTLHTMDLQGGDLRAISPFEMFEWTPSVASDGTLLYSRWDYVDRDNMPYMGLWSIHPDGTHSRIVYGNFTKPPHCTFEPRSIPNSHRIIFTASGHHAQTMGSLVLLDPALGSEGEEPVRRLTPEVPFPEIEAWPDQYFANPWPLSERFYLVSWGCETNPQQGHQRSPSGMGIYLFDAQGGLELLYKDPSISSAYPIPLKERKRPPILAETKNHRAQEGRFMLMNVYDGLPETPKGAVKAIRIVAVPAKTHPTMNYPNMGLTRDDPGKCVLGTVPVDKDGSAYFQAPAGVCLFFQAVDREGLAVQTMRSATHVQPGQTLSCIGCHEPRHKAPPIQPSSAMKRPASRIRPGPTGSWPVRFDKLVQPVLDKHCIRCHAPEGLEKSRDLDLTPPRSYETLTQAGKPSLAEHVRQCYREGQSLEGRGAASTSPVLNMLLCSPGHHQVVLEHEDRERLIVWMDTYGQRLGAFSQEQEEAILKLRDHWKMLLVARDSIGSALPVP